MAKRSRSSVFATTSNNVATMSTALLAMLSVMATCGSSSSSSSLFNGVNAAAAATATRHRRLASPYKIIIDGGSTGSRLHIFEFVDASSKDAGDMAVQEENLESDESVDDSPECVRRGSSRANIPLSAFGRLPSEQHLPLDAAEVAAHLLPLFEYAATVIPAQYHGLTSVKYQATAGMRLLSSDEQEAVYDALYDGLVEAPSFVFTAMQREDIATLGGEMEGFYGAVAANYLKGIVDSRMRMQQSRNQMQGTESFLPSSTSNDNHGTDSFPVGALDMGGSSTQIVFLPRSDDGSSAFDPTQSCPAETTENVCEAPELREDHFFATSYLSYGVDQFRQRLWTTLIQERKIDNGDAEGNCVNKIVPNPCANKGYQVEWEGFTLFGTGDTDECIRQTKRLIPHPHLPLESHEQPGNQVGGVQHPPISGKFLAMSLYYFSLDSLRVFSEPDREAHEALNDSWPNPSIEELYNALDGLCARDWHGDMEHQQGKHTFTRAEVLPHRCIETVYMVSLLKYGYGFAPDSRDITFTFLVDGSEVEWTLGMALAMHADEHKLEDSSSTQGRDDDDNEQQQQSFKNNVTFGNDDENSIPGEKLSVHMIAPPRPVFLAERSSNSAVGI